MEVHYKIDAGDYCAAQQYICRSVVKNSIWRFVPNVFGGIFGFCLVFGVVTVIKFCDKYKFIDFYELYLGIGVIVAGVVILSFGLQSYGRAIKARMFNEGGFIRTPHKINLADEHLVVTTKDSRCLYSYTDIVRVDDDQRHVYVFIDNSVALYIPVTSFATADAKKAFISELSNKINW